MSKTDLLTRDSFNKTLKLFVGATKNSMKYARICAEASIRQFEAHGDLSFAQDLLDNMPKNYVRRAAYLKWLSAHAPVTMSEGKLSKDKSEKAVAFDLEGALKAPFWEFAPDPENVAFTFNDVVKDLSKVIKRYKNSDRYTPVDADAQRKLDQAEEAIKALVA